MDKAVASLDQAAALRRLDGDTDIYLMLVGVFLEDAPVQMQKLGEAIRTGDAWSAVSVAHTLKSSARTVGAMILGDLCDELEHDLATVDPESAGNLFARLLAEYTHVARLLAGDIIC
jgi:HPt (histidine-containing phosphotransfer) domain-containing protein